MKNFQQEKPEEGQVVLAYSLGWFGDVWYPVTYIKDEECQWIMDGIGYTQEELQIEWWMQMPKRP